MGIHLDGFKLGGAVSQAKVCLMIPPNHDEDIVVSSRVVPFPFLAPLPSLLLRVYSAVHISTVLTPTQFFVCYTFSNTFHTKCVTKGTQR